MPEGLSKSTGSDDNQPLEAQIQKLALVFEKMRLGDYITLAQKPGRLLLVNFMTGLARGLGIAVGFTLVGALVLYLLQRVVMLNLPVIGTFIAEIVRIVNAQLGNATW